MQKRLFFKGELSAVLSLSALLAIRMLGLFMLLPVLATQVAVWAEANEFRVGLALGIYGLSQALLQIPFGFLSDRFGRKNILYLGLGLLILGSLCAAWSTSIWGLILGRFFQGAGAIGCVVLATVADVTREQVRGLAMAMTGICIGGAFMLAMVLGPMIAHLMGVRSLFTLTAILAAIALLIVRHGVPEHVDVRKTQAMSLDFRGLISAESGVLTFGVFCLHALLAMIFLVVPLALHTFYSTEGVWKFYLPILVGSLVVALPLVGYADRKASDSVRWLALLTLIIGISMLIFWNDNFHSLCAAMVFFFVGFNVLEAHLPARVSKLVPKQRKGLAMGIFSSAQFFGVFFGGMIGGLLHVSLGPQKVLLAALMIALSWVAALFWLRHHQQKHMPATNTV